MKEEKYHLALDKYEHGVVIKSLNALRNDLMEEEKSTEFVDELIIKTADAPKKNYKIIERPCCHDER